MMQMGERFPCSESNHLLELRLSGLNCMEGTCKSLVFEQGMALRYLGQQSKKSSHLTCVVHALYLGIM